MQRSYWFLGVLASLLSTLALGQDPRTLPQNPQIPPIELPPLVRAEPVAGAAGILEAQTPFVAQYVFCNAMQLYQSRRQVWEPVYRDSGASEAELEAHSANLVLFVKAFCADGPREHWQGALDRIEAFDALTDDRTAKALGVSLEDATSFRMSRLLANTEAFQRECMGGEESGALQDLLTVVGSALPATLGPAGLSLPRKDFAATSGRCSSPTAGSGASSGYGIDQRSLSACIDNALAQSATCDSPVGDGPSGAPIRREGGGGRCSTTGAETRQCTGQTTLVYGNGSRTEISSETDEYNENETGRRRFIQIDRRSSYDKDGELVGLEEVTTVDGVVVEHTVSLGEGRSRAQIRADRAGERLPLSEPEGYRLVTRKYSEGENRSVWEDVLEPVEGTASSPSGRECRSMNPASAMPLGLSRVGTVAAGGGGPVHAGRLDTFDLIGRCICTSLGKLGPELAARSGLRCGPDENTRRADCLLNPQGPADGIRPECVRYLQEDNPGRDTRAALSEWCGRVAQCPPGAGVAAASSSGGAACSCGTGLATPAGRGSGSPGSSRCASVSCARGPGAAGSDLYRECCGAPGELPIPLDPSADPPVPPRPGPGEKQKQAPPAN